VYVSLLFSYSGWSQATGSVIHAVMHISVMFQTQERFVAHERLIWFVLSLQSVSGYYFLLDYFFNSTELLNSSLDCSDWTETPSSVGLLQKFIKTAQRYENYVRRSRDLDVTTCGECFIHFLFSLSVALLLQHLSGIINHPDASHWGHFWL